MDMLVAADDRTGAFETAAVLADRGAGPVDVTWWPEWPVAAATAAVGVVDLGSRHLAVAEAQARVAAIPETRRAAHKIDSTLRGNWAVELAERAARRPVLLVPALPELGRTCVDGVVLEHGRPVHEGPAGSDARRPVSSSRPSDLLAAAGSHDVTEASESGVLDSWFEAPRGICVADASTSCHVEHVVGRWARQERVVLAGTSAVVGAAGACLSAASPAFGSPGVDGPVLVVCGSLHAVARAQVEHAASEGVPVFTEGDAGVARELAAAGCAVIVTTSPVGTVDEPEAAATAARLRDVVVRLAGRTAIGALVVVGGDTAAAVACESPVTLHGSLLPGTAWASAPGFDHPVVTRAGGFGDVAALVDLIRAVRGR